MTDREAAIARAVENLHRVDLTSIEEAKVYARLQDKHHMTLEEIAERMKKKPGTVKRRLDLLKMPPQLQTAVHRKEISVSVAEELWPISDPTALEYYLMFAVENGCTKNVARSWTKEWKDQSRRAEASGDGLPLPLSPQAPRPIFIACDLCHGPVELGKDRMLRICPDCYGEIKKAIGGPL